ncbi:Hypothetical predicted protein [Olea europaea subsp. europaea]|uniref:Uncharacterized protein n=1 Tax=Olea europaea subsp. europaea TaxID=158383 RepID=A0A8S0QNX7_OLEEU|nr:Hypothetical predicted protein [Olea europaea subsp. europaea]
MSLQPQILLWKINSRVVVNGKPHGSAQVDCRGQSRRTRKNRSREEQRSGKIEVEGRKAEVIEHTWKGCERCQNLPHRTGKLKREVEARIEAGGTEVILPWLF